jgi:hypothetical protein
MTLGRMALSRLKLRRMTLSKISAPIYIMLLALPNNTRLCEKGIPGTNNSNLFGPLGKCRGKSFLIMSQVSWNPITWNILTSLSRTAYSFVLNTIDNNPAIKLSVQSIGKRGMLIIQEDSIYQPTEEKNAPLSCISPVACTIKVL